MKIGNREAGGGRSGRFRAALMSFGCALVLPAAAMAQEAIDAAADSDERTLDAVEVIGTRALAATKTDTPITEVPQSISVITNQEFRDRNAIDLQDIYRYSAGVAPSASIDSRGDFVQARGFDAVQYLDGLKRMPDFIYGARLENFTLERAEVLRGPSSVLYGAGGPGGVLNGASKTPNFEGGGEAGVVVGTDSRLQAQADVSRALSESVAGRIVLLARDGESQWGTPDDRIVVNPSLKWRIGTDTELTLIGLYQDDMQGSLGYVPLSKSLLAPRKSQRTDFNFYQGEPGFNGMDTKFTSGAALFRHNFSPAISFSSATRYSEMDTDYKEIYSDLSDGGGVVYVSPFEDAEETLLRREFYVNREKSKVLNTDNHVAVDIGTGPFRHKVLVGIDYTWFDQTKNEGFSCSGWLFPPCFSGGSPPPINIYDPQYGASFDYGYTNFLEYGSTQLGIYVQDQISYGDRVHLLLGLRRDKATSERNGVDELDQTAWSFRGGLIAEVVDGVSPYFSYSESFLPVPGGDFFGNSFEPREARQYEVGVKWEPMRGALFTLAYFDIEESNYISQDPTNIQNFIQGGSVGSVGYEAEATIRLPGDFDFIASYGYTEAEVLTSSQYLNAGDRVAGVPEHLAAIWAVKTFDLQNGVVLRAGGGSRFIGRTIDSTQNFETPSATLADAMVSASYRDWVVSVNASNLFNHKYYATCGLSSPPDGYCVAAKDRTILASLTRRF